MPEYLDEAEGKIVMWLLVQFGPEPGTGRFTAEFLASHATMIDTMALTFGEDAARAA